MTVDRFVAIVNPVAGRGRGPRLWQRAERQLADAGRRFVTVQSDRSDHATELARCAAERGAEIVVVVGGDGTLNEVVNGLLSGRTDQARPTVACFPIGTGNDFARGLGIGGTDDAVRALLDPRPRAVDVAWARGVGGRPRAFVNALSVGLGAEIAGGLTASSRRLGPAAFVLIALAAIGRHRPAPAVVRIDGLERDLGPVALLVVANSPWAGGGMRLAPPARTDDGVLDLVVAAAVPRLVMALRLLPAARSGRHLAHPAVTHLTGRRFTVESSARYEVDGQIVGAGPVEIWLEPTALRVLARDGADAG